VRVFEWRSGHLSEGWIASDETWGLAGERLDLCIRQMFK
jgi:hypothetical protein